MKKSAIKITLVGVVLVAVILWSLLSNYYRGSLNAPASAPATVNNPTVTSKEATAINSASETVVTAAAAAVQQNTGDDFARSQFCRAQYQEFIRIADGAALRAQYKKNPNTLDERCFKLSTIKGIDPKDCSSGLAAGETVNNAICGAFLTYYKYMLTDYLTPVPQNLNELPDDILRIKVRSQFVARADHDAKLMVALAEELYRRNSNDLRTLKIYLQAQYLIPGTDFSETGKLYPLVAKAFKLAPKDHETQQFMAYSLMTSDGGLFRLTELGFLNDDYYQYYFYAWYHWKNKTDPEKTKAHLQAGYTKSTKYKYMFEALLKTVSDKNTKFGEEGIFALQLEPMPNWENQ